MAWALGRADTTGGGGCADGIGMGKTLEIICVMRLMTYFQVVRRGGEGFGPTLVVVPSMLRKGWLDTLKKTLVKMRPEDTEWRIFLYGEHEQPGFGNKKNKVELKDNSVWCNTHLPNHHQVICVTDPRCACNATGDRLCICWPALAQKNRGRADSTDDMRRRLPPCTRAELEREQAAREERSAMPSTLARAKVYSGKNEKKRLERAFTDNP